MISLCDILSLLVDVNKAIRVGAVVLVYQFIL